MKKILTTSVLKSFPFGKGFRIGLLLIIFSVTLCKAQWVTIPDANFVAYLHNNFPQCMNGNLLDTTCSENVISVYCPSLNIVNLNGIQYFSNLQQLTCSNNHLTSLPPLPNTLITLDCGFNQFTSLPQLPNSLGVLLCQNNFLTSLPLLPISLTTLNCSTNSISNLPILPSLFSTLICSFNQLTLLPLLPNSMKSIICSYNQITNLPSLPNSFVSLDCSHNQISSLPIFPNSFALLDCSNNQLINLPLLPDSLYYFKATSNPQLLCMSVLNKFGGTNNYFNISNTGITCLPNTIQHTGYIAEIDTMPICSCVYPSSVTVSNITTISAKVSWNAECCAGFKTQYRITGTITWSTINAGPLAVTQIINSLTPATTYDLRMKVLCSNGTTFSGWSPIQTFTTLGSACTAPANLTVTGLSQTQATVNWNTVTGVYSYKVAARKLGTSAWYSYTVLAPTTFKTLNWLTANTTYQYRLQTICNASGTPTSSWTPINTFTTLLRLEDSQTVTASSFSVNPNPCTYCEITGVENASDLTVTDIIGRNINASFSKSASGYYINLSETSTGVFIIRNINTGEVVKFVRQ